MARAAAILGWFTTVSATSPGALVLLQLGAQKVPDGDWSEDNSTQETFAEIREQITSLENRVASQRSDQVAKYERILAQYRENVSKVKEDNTALEADFEAVCTNTQRLREAAGTLMQMNSNLTSEINELRSQLMVGYAAAVDMVEYAEHQLQQPIKAMASEKKAQTSLHSKHAHRPKAALMATETRPTRTQSTLHMMSSLLTLLKQIPGSKIASEKKFEQTFKGELAKLVAEVKEHSAKQKRLRSSLRPARKVMDNLEQSVGHLDQMNFRLEHHRNLLLDALDESFDGAPVQPSDAITETNQTQQGEMWIGRKALQSSFDMATIEHMVENGILISRANPDIPDRTQYKLQGDADAAKRLLERVQVFHERRHEIADKFGCGEPTPSCTSAVRYAMTTGIQEHPEWYPGLTTASEFQDFQAHYARHSPDTECKCAAAEAAIN